MKITVINGTEKHGVTYKLKEIFLSEFAGKAEITEYYLPKDCPNFCIGCAKCFAAGEQNCKDYRAIQRIENSLLEADLIVMTSPAYVFHATGGMKTLLDHFAYRWMPHRPAKEMFRKRAVILTQCLGAGAKSAAKDIKDSLSWWGISEISVFSDNLMEDILWDGLADQKKAHLSRKVRRIAQAYTGSSGVKPGRTSLSTKIKFHFVRIMQRKLHRENPEYLDASYWAEQGWLGSVRPWKD